MSSIPTIGRWIDLPTAGGAADRFRLDQPLGADVMQIASSNAIHAARVNGLRTLWEHPGSDDVGSGGGLFDPGSPDTMPWDMDPADADAPLILFAGYHRIRPWGETDRLPRVALSLRMAAAPDFEAGVMLVATRRPGRPSTADLWGSETTASGTLTDVDVILAPDPLHLSRRSIAPRLGTVDPAPDPPESGVDTALAFYVAAWSTGVGLDKAVLAGLTLYLLPPE